MRRDDTNPDAATLALMALGWVLSDARRAERLLAVTGLDADTLRAGIDDPATLAALLGFLEGYEPDLIACAQALDTTPESLVTAQRTLEA